MLAGGLCCLMSSCKAIHKWTAPKSQAVQAVQIPPAIGTPVTTSGGPVTQSVIFQGDPFELALSEAGRNLFSASRNQGMNFAPKGGSEQ